MRDHEDTTHMSPTGKRLFAFATALSRKQVASHLAAPEPPSTIGQMLKLSDLSELIAHHLAHAAALGYGVPFSWADLPLSVKGRYRQLAERAILTIDPQVRLDAAQDAISETEDWINGPYLGQGTEPTQQDIARYAISAYEAILSTVTP